MAGLGKITMWVVGIYDTQGIGDWAVVKSLDENVRLQADTFVFDGEAGDLELWCIFWDLGCLIREIPITLTMGEKT